MKHISLKIMIAASILVACSFSAMAGNGVGNFSRSKGTIGRIGVGAPANFEIGLGYQFNRYFSLTAEALSFSGLTAVAGVVDARWYMLDKTLTPFADAKIGAGILGKDIDNQNCFGPIGSITAGLSWRRFDIGAGIICDPFHKVEFTSSLTWTYNFGRR
ncbi:MAG: hypothetical protein MJY73_06715 [Bacteroidales bacterium]|nr:hypothetical protein [Bacteroidales bacterium]